MRYHWHDLLNDAGWVLEIATHHLVVAGRVLWHLPIVKCPACRGEGGAVEGYYEPEWCECSFCWDVGKWFGEWDNLGWFIGRVHPLRYPLVLFRWRTGYPTVRGWISCKVGWHRPDDDGRCVRCYEMVAGGGR